MVDIAWLPLLHRASIIESRSGFEFLEDFPRVKAWQAAILGTGLAERSVSEDFEERFTAFYLSETTFLGRLSRENCGEACHGDPECTVDSVACCSN